jgi:hypothetical protein
MKKLVVSLSTAMALVATAQAQNVPVRVTADAPVTAPYPVSIVVTKAALKKLPKAPKGTPAIPAQFDAIGKDKLRVTFLVNNLGAGESKLFVATPSTNTELPELTVSLTGADAEVKRGDKLIARYDVSTGPTKPYLYPILPFGDDVHMTRRWPVEKGTDEAEDHPHHRGLWFTHGDINGIDFWTEAGDEKHRIGKTVHTNFPMLAGGPIQAHLTSTTDWNDPEGKTIAKDTRSVTFTPVGAGMFLDFSITVTPTTDDLKWGDTKEGTFAIRVPEAIKGDKTGTMINAEGLKQGALWGKASAWVDNSGTIDGKSVGVAIFDSPANPRHPTTWHARTYGLFAVNPFGLHDFDASKKNDKTAGQLITPRGKSVTFAYRVYFHQGDATQANVATVAKTYAKPPKVTLVP